VSPRSEMRVENCTFQLTHKTLENHLENWRFLSKTNYYGILSTKFQSRLVVERETDSFVGNIREKWSIDGQNP
jgi:hypothetical protein